MTVVEFVNKYDGKKIDFDNYAGPQCVDLARQYIKEGLDIPEHTGSCSTSGGAKDLFLDYDKMPVEKKYFSRIKSKTGKPGDIAVWDSSSTNQYGHVAIVLSNFDSKNLIVFEQDGFKKDGARIRMRSKTNLLGFLRKK